MTNYLKEGSIKVTKTTTGNLNIKDIRFVVKGISDTNSDIERELFTDENGEALFENLPIGKYTVTEDGLNSSLWLFGSRLKTGHCSIRTDS